MANTETTIQAVSYPRESTAPIHLETVLQNLKRNGFVPHYFPTKEEALAYLTERITHTTVAIGDSRTLEEIGLHDELIKTNDVTNIQRPLPGESFRETALRTMGRPVFLTSVNALAATGEMVNIDGTGNRVAASLFGSLEVFFVLGINKITLDLASAIYRARNVAAPMNVIKNKKISKTPCAVKQDHCYDCASPDRICNALTIYYKKMRNMDTMEVVIIGEELGF